MQDLSAGICPSDFAPSAEQGVDLTQLDERQRLTPTERVQRHSQMLSLAEELRRAGEERHGIRQVEVAQSNCKPTALRRERPDPGRFATAQYWGPPRLDRISLCGAA
jgi:hypothetical protein